MSFTGELKSPEIKLIMLPLWVCLFLNGTPLGVLFWVLGEGKVVKDCSDLPRHRWSCVLLCSKKRIDRCLSAMRSPGQVYR